MTTFWVLLATAVVVVAVGLLLRRRAGRVHAAPPGAQPLPPVVLAELTARAALPRHDGVTLLQLSTTFCAPCRQARVLLADLAERTPGLRHVEVDVTDRPDLSGPLRVRSTPTTLAVDANGRELLRLVGVPRRDTLLDALRPYLGPHLGPHLGPVPSPRPRPRLGESGANLTPRNAAPGARESG